MAKDVAVVDAKAIARVTNVNGKRVDIGPGEVAIERELIAANLAAAARRFRVLDRAPREEEVQRSVARGLIREASGSGDDDRPLTELRKDDLVTGAGLLGLDQGGNKADLVARIEEEAQRLEVSTEGPGLEVIARAHDAQLVERGDVEA